MKKPLPNHNTLSQTWRWRVILVKVACGLVVGLGGLGNGSTIWAANPEVEALTITSDRMELDDNQQVAIFTGAVQAEEKQMKLTADKMTVTYRRHKPDPNTPAQQKSTRGGVEKIWAVGGAELVQGESRGKAEEMIFLVDKQTLELLGKTKNASIHHGRDRLEGMRIFLTIGADQTISKISVQGGKQQRVSARITPPEEEDERSQPPSEPTTPVKSPGPPVVKPVHKP